MGRETVTPGFQEAGRQECFLLPNDRCAARVNATVSCPSQSNSINGRKTRRNVRRPFGFAQDRLKCVS